MKIWLRLKYWSQRQAESLLRKLVAPQGMLRQFVYLDEVVLRSLMASRYGAHVETEIESRTVSRRGEVGGTFSSISGVANTKMSGKYMASNSRNQQVERQTTIQSMFKEFLEREKMQGLAWSSLGGHDEKYPRTLTRGDLVEVRVRLAADPLYRVSSFLAEMNEMAAGMPDGFGTQLTDGLQIGDASVLLQRFMVDQVPLRAEIVDFAAIATAEKIEVVKKESEDTNQVPLYLVGVSELLGYWQDTRRVLFSEREVTALVRVAVDGPLSSWSPVKLLEMVGGPFSELKSDMAQLAEWTNADVVEDENADVLALVSMLENYSQMVVLKSSAVPRGIDEAALRISRELHTKLPSGVAMTEAFAELDAWLEGGGAKLRVETNRTERRRMAREAAQVNILGKRETGESMERAAAGAGYSAAFIEAEIIALYW